MKTLLAFLVGALVLTTPVQAQPRVYSQAELDSLLAPVALHPDGLLSQILIAATYPEEVAAAAGWSRANPHLRGDDAVRAVQNEPWDPTVKALVAFPDLLARMDESPQWLQELGEAFLLQQAQVMDTVQGLRRRAQATGHLNNSDHAVYQQGEAIVVEPRAQVVYVRHYDPYVVYGPWWWPHYHPVFWSPWIARPVFFTPGFFYVAPVWHHRHVRVVHRPVHVPHHVVSHVVPGKWHHARHGVVTPGVRPQGRVPETHRQPVNRGTPGATPPTHSRPLPAPRARETTRQPIIGGTPPDARPATRSHPQPAARVRETNRQPIVQQHMPAAHGFSQHRPPAAQPRIEARREMRVEPRREMRFEQRRESGQGRGHRG